MASKLKSYEENRRAFLSNITHELKTPVTKGKLCLEFLDKSIHKKILNTVFLRLEYLMNEMLYMDHVCMPNVNIIKQDCNLNKLLLEAKRLLFLEHLEIEHNFKPEDSIKADFEGLSIIFKNLIDNALKHGSDRQVRLHFDGFNISFINKSESLKENLQKHDEPFFQGNLTSTNKKGFGLGFYIINHIARLHHFTIDYDYQDGYSYFKIITSKI